jgi:type I pantothenate kinase
MKRLHHFTRAEWSACFSKPLPSISPTALADCFGFAEPVSTEEWNTIYVPLAQWLVEQVDCLKQQQIAHATYLQRPLAHRPCIIGIGGSVAVGKSTTSRLLQYTVSQLRPELRIGLVPTDGFLWPNAVLASLGLLDRKGFPESYDMRRLLHFIEAMHAGSTTETIPVYSHHRYNIIPDCLQSVGEVDVLLLEGLNVLQLPHVKSTVAGGRHVVSDYLDYGIYVDAPVDIIESWFVERLQAYIQDAAHDPEAYLYRYKDYSAADIQQQATRVWREVNAVNLVENIAPSKARADLVVVKSASHAVSSIQVRA